MERLHIGEEIADVFIYTTRLSDMCYIDLAEFVRTIASNFQWPNKINDEVFEKLSISNRPTVKDPWEELTFEELENSYLRDYSSVFRSQRHIALSLQCSVGQVCNMFGQKPERECSVGLQSWSSTEVAKLASLLGTICILLHYLAKRSNHSLSQCITDKFAKNEAKYPVERCKGSSAKYTHYLTATSDLREQELS